MSLVLESLWVSLWIVSILIIWFKSDATIVYGKLLGLSFLKINEFELVNKDRPTGAITYHQFLLEYYPNFVVKLVVCPICVSFWLSLLTCLAFFSSLHFVIIFYFSLSLYYFLSMLMRHAEQ